MPSIDNTHRLTRINTILPWRVSLPRRFAVYKQHTQTNTDKHRQPYCRGVSHCRGGLPSIDNTHRLTRINTILPWRVSLPRRFAVYKQHTQTNTDKHRQPYCRGVSHCRGGLPSIDNTHRLTRINTILPWRVSLPRRFAVYRKHTQTNTDKHRQPYCRGVSRCRGGLPCINNTYNTTAWSTRFLQMKPLRIMTGYLHQSKCNHLC